MKLLGLGSSHGVGNSQLSSYAGSIYEYAMIDVNSVVFVVSLRMRNVSMNFTSKTMNKLYMLVNVDDSDNT